MPCCGKPCCVATCSKGQKIKLEPRQIRMLCMIVLNITYMIVELSVGVMGNCLSLIADSFNLISDAIGLTVGFTTIMMGKREANPRMTFGWKRSEALGAFFNGSFLISSSFFLLTQIVDKFIEPEKLDNIDIVLYVGIGGLIENIIGVCMINSWKCCNKKPRKAEAANLDDETVPLTQAGKENKKKRDMAVHGAFLIILQDMLGSIIVTVSVTIQKLAPDWKFNNYIDPTCSIIMVCFLVSAAVPLLKEVFRILMLVSPVSSTEVSDKLLTIEHVLQIRHLRIWEQVPDKYVCHFKCLTDVEDAAAVQEVKQKLAAVIKQYGINDITIEIVYRDEASDAPASGLDEDNSNQEDENLE